MLHLLWETVGNSSSSYTGQVVVSSLLAGQRTCSSDSKSAGPAKAQAIVAKSSGGSMAH